MEQPDHLLVNNLDGGRDLSIFDCLAKRDQQCVCLLEEKFKRDVEKANHHLLYLQKLLAKCYKHGVLFIFAEEVNQCLKGIKDEIDKKAHTLCFKILYRGNTSGSDAHQRLHLYKVNQLSLAEMKICDAPNKQC